MITNYEGDKEPEFTSTAAPAAAPPRSSVAAAAQVEVPAEARRPGCGARMWPGRDLHSLRAETAHAKLCSLNNTLIWPSWSARGVAPHQPQCLCSTHTRCEARRLARSEGTWLSGLRPRPAQDVRGQSSCSMNTSYSTSLGYLTLLQAKHHTPNETSMFRVQSSEFISSFGVFAVAEERKGRDGGGGGGDRSGGQDAARRSGRGAAALACQRSHSLDGNVLV